MHEPEDVMGLKPGDNPRHVLPRHEERKSVFYEFDLNTVAEAAGVNYQTVRKAVSTGRLQLKDLTSAERLRSVAGYIQRALVHKSKPIHSDEARGSLSPEMREWWDNRWPKFELYRCPHPKCNELLFGPGACAEHGGEKRPLIKLDSDGHVVLLLGRDYIPLHRVVAQTPRGLHTHHRDGNPWNNRWPNLECLEPKEHESRHVGSVLSAKVHKKQPPRRAFRSEVGGMTKAELQKKLDEAYMRGLKDGQQRQ
jgi:hypothetical protein